MELRISKRKMRLAQAVRAGGSGLVVLSLLLSLLGVGLWILWIEVAGFAITLAGYHWIRSLYRCPRCEEPVSRNRDQLPDPEHYRFCPKCGTQLKITWTD